MRIFNVGPDNGFTEYERVPFEANHEESVLEEWLESNPDGVLEDGPFLIIGRQVPTDLGKVIDLLGVDREGNVVVVELKRDRTPRDVIAQALEYAAFAAKLDAAALEGILGEYRPDEPLGLAEQHREYFDQTEAVAFNKDQRIVIIGQQVTPEIRRTALFLGAKGVQVTCAEFSFFQAADGGRLLSQEIVVGGEQAKPRGRSRRTAPLSRAEFLESCDDHGRAVYSRILDLAIRKGMVLKWGTTCFYIVVDVEGAQEPVCTVGLPASKYGQAFWTSLGSDYWGIRKTGVPIEVVEQLWGEAQQTRLFVRAGKELKCPIDRVFTDDEVNAFVAWCELVEQAIRKHAATGELTPG